MRIRTAALYLFVGALNLAVLLTGCETAPKPPPEKIVISKNTVYKCEPPAVIQKQMLQLVNAARRSRRQCGNTSFAATGRVRWNSKLTGAARQHSRDMATTGRLSHIGSDRSVLVQRVEHHGYRWKTVGENIAGGYETSTDTVSNWLKSPPHCANLMQPTFTEIGAACARNSSTKLGTHWTLVLGSQ